MRIPTFSVIFGDLLDGIFGAIFDAISAVLAAIGDLLLAMTEMVLGSDRPAIAIPIWGSLSGLLVFGGGAMMAEPDAPLISTGTAIVAGVVVVIVVAMILASRRRRHR
ncbi:MAG: hypothetical protein AAGF49_14265 [Pseudomonadota bacterium]